MLRSAGSVASRLASPLDGDGRLPGADGNGPVTARQAGQRLFPVLHILYRHRAAGDSLSQPDIVLTEQGRAAVARIMSAIM